MTGNGNGNGKKYTIGAIAIASMATLVVSLILSFVTISANVAKKDDVISLETRIRILETSQAASTEKIENLKADVEDLRQTVELLSSQLYPHT